MKANSENVGKHKLTNLYYYSNKVIHDINQNRVYTKEKKTIMLAALNETNRKYAKKRKESNKKKTKREISH